jgi:hypothetical protein
MIAGAASSVRRLREPANDLRSANTKSPPRLARVRDGNLMLGAPSQDANATTLIPSIVNHSIGRPDRVGDDARHHCEAPPRQVVQAAGMIRPCRRGVKRGAPRVGGRTGERA